MTTTVMTALSLTVRHVRECKLTKKNVLKLLIYFVSFTTRTFREIIMAD